MPDNKKHQAADKYQSRAADDQTKSQPQDNKNGQQTRVRDFNKWLKSSVPNDKQEDFDKAFNESIRHDKIDQALRELNSLPATSFGQHLKKNRQI